MEPGLIAVCAVQVIVLAIVVCGIVLYLLRHLMFRSRYEASGKSVLVTGCDSGLGWELARHFDRMGFQVYAGFVNPAGEGAVRLQTEASARTRIIHLDVTSTASLQNAARILKDQLTNCDKGLWALVNAASHCVCGELVWQTREHCQKQLDVNFIAVVQAVRIFLPLLKTSQGRIINVGDLADTDNYPQPGLSMYSATKYAIEGLSKTLRCELARDKVGIAVVRPDAATVEKFLLEGHHRNMNEMWDQMTAELRRENQDAFIAYHDRVAKEGIDVDDLESGSRPGLSSYLVDCFEDAMLSKKPHDTYVAVPGCLSRFKLTASGLLPSGWGEYFIQRKYKHNIASIFKV